MKVKNSHIICYHEISPGSQQIQETLDERWQSDLGLALRRVGESSLQVNTWRHSQLRDSGHGEVLESGQV